MSMWIAIPARDSAIFRTLRNASNQKPAINAISTAHPCFDLEPFATFQSRLPTLAKERLVFRMDHFEERFSPQLLCAQAQIVAQVVIADTQCNPQHLCATAAAELLR